MACNTFSSWKTWGLTLQVILNKTTNAYSGTYWNKTDCLFACHFPVAFHFYDFAIFMSCGITELWVAMEVRQTTENLLHMSTSVAAPVSITVPFSLQVWLPKQTLLAFSEWFPSAAAAEEHLASQREWWRGPGSLRSLAGASGSANGHESAHHLPLYAKSTRVSLSLPQPQSFPTKQLCEPHGGFLTASLTLKSITNNHPKIAQSSVYWVPCFLQLLSVI